MYFHYCLEAPPTVSMHLPAAVAHSRHSEGRSHSFSSSAQDSHRLHSDRTVPLMWLPLFRFPFYLYIGTFWGRPEQFKCGMLPVKSSEINFDDILNLIGGFGKFQKLLYVWICLPQIFLAFHMLVSVFTGAVPPHLCRSARTQMGISTSMNISIQRTLACIVPLNHSSAAALGEVHSCQGWEYSTDTFQRTTVTEVS